MKNLKKNKGVTLIALVITIIVLLILAGVALAMIMGDSGIFGKANKSSEKTLLAKDWLHNIIAPITSNISLVITSPFIFHFSFTLFI